MRFTVIVARKYHRKEPQKIMFDQNLNIFLWRDCLEKRENETVLYVSISGEFREAVHLAFCAENAL